MKYFTIYPAIDLRQGQVVRLQYGDPERQTVFGHDPAAVADRWVAAGADWLHVVNLDGAFNEAGTANWQVLPTLVKSGARIQFGGGIRTLEDIERALDAGVTRVVLGTLAVEQPDLVAHAIIRFGSGHIAVALDAREGLVKTRGWQKSSGLETIAVGREMRERGVTGVIHTDIGRDGVFTGVNVEASAALAQATGLDVTASGGVAGLDDVRQAAGQAAQGVTGLIIGRALYENRLELAQAIEIARSTPLQSAEEEEEDAG